MSVTHIRKTSCYISWCHNQKSARKTAINKVYLEFCPFNFPLGPFHLKSCPFCLKKMQYSRHRILLTRCLIFWLFVCTDTHDCRVRSVLYVMWSRAFFHFYFEFMAAITGFSASRWRQKRWFDVTVRKYFSIKKYFFVYGITYYRYFYINMWSYVYEVIKIIIIIDTIVNKELFYNGQ